jgi:hypothetical protein
LITQQKLYSLLIAAIMHAINFSPYINYRKSSMSEQKESKYNDGLNDAIAATAVIALVVTTMIYWLSGMPS